MAPSRDPESIGELWQFIKGELRLLELRIESDGRVATAAIQRLVETVKTQDARLDEIEASIHERRHLPERMTNVEGEVEKLRDKQTQAIAGGSVLLFLASVAWPVVKGWLHI